MYIKTIHSFLCLLLAAVFCYGAAGTFEHNRSDASLGTEQTSYGMYRLFETVEAGKTRTEALQRLDAFTSYLRDNPSFVGYIISFGGRRSCANEARKRGAAIKMYVSKDGGIEKIRSASQFPMGGFVNGGRRTLIWCKGRYSSSINTHNQAKQGADSPTVYRQSIYSKAPQIKRIGNSFEIG